MSWLLAPLGPQVGLPGVPAPRRGWVYLDVQRGLLACEESEHGRRHGLHVDL